MSIYTRRGDQGETSLGDGSRVSKASLRVEAYGALDEASSAVGLARVPVTDGTLDAVLGFVQQRLFNCASALATPEPTPGRPAAITSEDIAFLEQAVDAFELRTGPLRNFVLPGGSEVAARIHVARATARRAERRIVSLAAGEEIDENVLAFVNRLSDLLFAAARYANAVAGQPDDAWDAEAARPEL